jgi:hypothetical protein
MKENVLVIVAAASLMSHQAGRAGAEYRRRRQLLVWALHPAAFAMPAGDCGTNQTLLGGNFTYQDATGDNWTFNSNGPAQTALAFENGRLAAGDLRWLEPAKQARLKRFD